MSKKLTGNGMWESSRMMLPQHRSRMNDHRRDTDQSQERVEPIRSLTTEESELVRDAFLFPYVEQLVEGYLQEIAEARQLKLNSYYVIVTELLYTSMKREYAKIRQDLRKRMMKVARGESDVNTVRIVVQLRGGELSLEMTREFARDRMIQMIRKGMQDIVETMKRGMEVGNRSS